MSRCVVTGAAGFIGSHLCDALLARGHEVVGIDGFIPSYPRSYKEANLETMRTSPRFRFVEADLRTARLHALLEGCAAVFHQAAMPGLVRSWSEFDLYVECNLNATQRLLEAARDTGVAHFLLASTSSVYGKEATGAEDAPLRPVSPYGVTKLAAEHLCRAFEATFGLPVTILRYFSVYGPRQRPDMAYHILIQALLTGAPFVRYGDGRQSRSNTFVTDCVSATLAAFERPTASVGETFNVGGGEVVSLNEVIQLLQEITGKTLQVTQGPGRHGDQRHTRANIEKATRVLGYEPRTTVQEGLEAQVAWHIERFVGG